MANFEKIFRTTDEQIEPIEANVTGFIPEWLNGSLIRVGPGVFDLGSGFTVNHFFDGYSILYKFDISNGKVEFRKRILQSDAYLKAQDNGKPVYREYGTRAYNKPNEVTTGYLARAIFSLIPDKTDNCNANIFQFGNSFFGIKGTSMVRSFNPIDLSTGEKVDLFPRLGAFIMVQYPIKDHNGDTYLVTSESVNSFRNKSNYNWKYSIYNIPKNNNTLCEAFKDAKLVTSLNPTTHCHFLNSFGISENYIIFIDSPLIGLCFKDIINRKKYSSNVSEGFHWLSDHMNRFNVIEKSSGKTLTMEYESKQPFFFIHIINCYEHNCELIVDVIGYDGPDILKHLDLNNLRNNQFNPSNTPQARRYILPLDPYVLESHNGVNLIKSSYKCKAVKNEDKISLTPRILCQYPHEDPNINRRYLGKKYKFYYASGVLFPGEYEFSIIKVNVESGEVKKWFAGDGQIPSEPKFIENPDYSSEDDGILLVCISSSQPDHLDRMVIIDAKNMQLLATATVPCHIPISRGGLFKAN